MPDTVPNEGPTVRAVIDALSRLPPNYTILGFNIGFTIRILEADAYEVDDVTQTINMLPPSGK